MADLNNKTLNLLKTKGFCFYSVRVKGLEPSHLAAPDPKSGVSTNFTIPASMILRMQIYIIVLYYEIFIHF